MKNKNKNKVDEFDFSDKTNLSKLKLSKISYSGKLKEYIEGNNAPTWTINYIVHLYKTEVLKNSVILVRMILRNGKITSFLVNTDKPVFTFQKGAYIIDTSKISEDIASGHATLLYHQEISLPLGLHTKIENTKDLIYDHTNDDIKEIRENINPNILRSTVFSTLIKQVMAGGLLDKQLKHFLIIMIINLVLTIILMIGTMINNFI